MPEVLPSLVVYTLWKVGSMSAHYEIAARGGARIHGQHPPVAAYPGLRDGRVSAGLICNPLVWYASLYEAARFRNRCDDVDFPTFVEQCFDGGFDRVGVIAEAGDVEDFRASGVGLATWCAWWMYSIDRRWAVDYLVPRDMLDAGLALLLGDDEQRRENQHENSNVQRDYADYYNGRPDLVERILDADAPLFRVGGWVDLGPALSPLIAVRGRALTTPALAA